MKIVVAVRWVGCSVLLLLGVLLAPGYAGAAEFDTEQALAISQAAIGRTVAEYSFKDPDGRTVSLSDYTGRPLVLSLIYTSCYHICPTTTQHLAKVVRIARAALGTDSFDVLTIGFDTNNDTPYAMGEFARQQGVDLPGWRFVSADADSVTRLAEQLGFIWTTTPRGFDHLIQASVIDGEGKVYRQVYGMQFETPALVEPLKELVYGQPRQGSLLTHLGNRIRLFCTVYDPASGQYRFDYSIFIGMSIGVISLSLVAWFVFREWRRLRGTMA